MHRVLLILFAFWSVLALGDDLPAWVSPEGRDDPHVGKVLDTANGIWLTPSMLVESLASAPHLLVGEKHDNPDHHRLQLWLMQRLQDKRPQGAVVMEMLEPSQQSAVDRLQGQPLQGDLELQNALGWASGWNWELYGPLVRWALDQPQRLLAANLGVEEIRTIYKAPPPQSPVYGEDAIALLNESIATSHCGKLPEEQFPAMLRIQQARDAHMAQQMLDAPTPALLLAGNFHVRKDLGVPLHWVRGEVPAPLVVMLVEAGGDLPDRTQADFVWLTPALPEQDYCAQWE